MAAGMIVIIAVAGYRPERVFDFFLENAAFSVLLIGLVVTYRRFALSDWSYLLIAMYLAIHEFGAHYKYSDVPLGEWMKSWLHTQRNMYDRVAHFSFGLLLSYPMQEFFMRVVGVTSRWRYMLPVEATLSFSAIYEMLEALMASILTPQRGEEFVGMQGDIWDSQEDMFMAGLGSVVAMAIVAVVRKRRVAQAAAQELAAVYVPPR